MQAIETLEHFEQALKDIVGAHTSLDRKDIADSIAQAMTGHPREAAIKLLLDGLCAGSHNLAGRQAAAAEIKELVHKYDDAPEPLVVGPVSAEGSAGTPETLVIETVHYADGSSATGPAPLPDNSPDGAPAIEAPAPPPLPVEEIQHVEPATEPEQIPEAPAVPEVPHVPESLQE